LIFSVWFDDRGLTDEVREAADHAAGAFVQVAAEPQQRSFAVGVQAQGVLQGGDEGLPGGAFVAGAVGERGGADQGVAAGDLTAASAGEQPVAFQVDSGQHEGGRDTLGEVLDLVGCLGADAGAEIEIV
jgi:hypothetical protein